MMDLFSAIRNGRRRDVSAALAALQKSGGNIDARSSQGCSPLHVAVWRNDIAVIKQLLAAGADPNLRDVESGWSCLHRAFHFGHLSAAAVLLEAGALLSVQDSMGRSPADLLSPLSATPLPAAADFRNGQSSDWLLAAEAESEVVSLLSGAAAAVGGESSSRGARVEVFSWGNGANYQLGIGTAGIQRTPCLVDSLLEFKPAAVAAARFHSLAVGGEGQLLSWGFGRGGRLGHTDFDIHSGQVAVIFPRLVTAGLGGRRVRAVAAAKHHSIAATEGGEVFTWGSNREGQLGYASVDSQPTPRRVASLRQKAVAVAAGNKHSAAVTAGGVIFTWGSNREAQLGYGTSNSSSNCTPRAVQMNSSSSRQMVAVAAAKHHTLALAADGEVWSWGHKLVTPRRVRIERDVKRAAGSSNVRFHRRERLVAVAVAAGFTHSTAITSDGLVHVWRSADSSLKSQQLSALASEHAVSVSAGKHRTAVVTARGDVWVWDQCHSTPKTGSSTKLDSLSKTPAAVSTPPSSTSAASPVPLEASLPSPTRMPGMKRVAAVSVGELHSLALVRIEEPKIEHAKGAGESSGVLSAGPVVAGAGDVELVGGFGSCSAATGGEEEQEELDFEMEMDEGQRRAGGKSENTVAIGSLKGMCEAVIIDRMLTPRTAMQLLEMGDALEAPNLKAYCQDFILNGLDHLVSSVPALFSHCSRYTLASLEAALKARGSSKQGSLRATNSNGLRWEEDEEEEEADGDDREEMRDDLRSKENSEPGWEQGGTDEEALRRDLGALAVSDSRFGAADESEKERGRKIRALRKKLQQVEILEEKMAEGKKVDAQQRAKVNSRGEIERELRRLEAGQEDLELADGLGGERDVEVKHEQEGKGDAKKVMWANDILESTVKRKNGKGGKLRKEKKEAVDAGHAKMVTRRKQDQERVVIRTNGFDIANIANFPAKADTDFSSKNPLETCSASSESPEASSGISFAVLSQAPTAASTDRKDPSSVTPANSSTATAKSQKKKGRKGGLAMFLNGELEMPAAVVREHDAVREEKLKDEGAPAWGKEKLIPEGVRPLREIQSEEEKVANTAAPMSMPVTAKRRDESREVTMGVHAQRAGGAKVEPKGIYGSMGSFSPGSIGCDDSFQSYAKRHSRGGLAKQGSLRQDGPAAVDHDEGEEALRRDGGGSSGRITVSLADFISRQKSSPITVKKAPSVGKSQAAWQQTSSPGSNTLSSSASKNSPMASSTSLRQIQMQQEQQSLQRMRRSPSGGGISMSPQASNVSFSPQSTPVPNRWFKPEEASTSSIRNIQVEEAAMKELRKMYGVANVRIASVRQ